MASHPTEYGPLKVLILEDSVKDAEIIRELLNDAGFSVYGDRCTSERDYLALLTKNRYDIILSDFSMPGYDAFGALAAAKTLSLETPFICVSGSIGEETAIALIKEGAVDYVLKDRLIRLPSAIQRALDDVRAKDARWQIEDALRESNQQFRTLADSGRALIWTAGTDKLCNYFNRVWLEFTGRSLEQELGNGWEEGVHPDDLRACLERYSTAFDRREKFSIEYRLRRYDGEYRWLIDDGSPRWDDKGVFIGYIGHCLDITGQKLVEAQLLKLNRTYAVLSSINQLIVRERDQTTLFTETCGIAVGQGDIAMCWIALIDMVSGRVRCAAHAGGRMLHTGLTESIASEHAGRMGPVGVTLRERKESICNDTGHEQDMAYWASAAAEAGYRSSAAFPLFIGDTCIGAINFYSSEAGFFNTEEIYLLGELSRDISFALEKIEHEKQRLRTEERNAEQARRLEESEAYYRSLVHATPDAIVILNEEGVITFASPNFNAVFGLAPDHVVTGSGITAWFHEDEREKIAHRITELFHGKGAHNAREYMLVKADAVPFWGEVSSSPLLGTAGEVTGALILCRDVTDRKKLQQELVQSQKLQSIGRLAGGIAHDFNNILGIILAYTSLMEKTRMTHEKYIERISGIDNAVKRGAALVKQILTFARKTDAVLEPVNLIELFRELLSMLKQTFPRTIVFEERYGGNIPNLFADRTQIHQALLNLCVNARDAMSSTGTITVSVDKLTGGEVAELFSSAADNWYVRITVADTGDGMTEAVKAKIFDPFFTTKEPGKGTGLGLSVVFGVVQTHHGYIAVNSVPGKGTTFRLYIPLAAHEPIALEEQVPVVVAGGSETILLVEDEEYLLDMMTMNFESYGYRVLRAQDGFGAVELFSAHSAEIHIVFSDMGLPGMTGLEAGKKMKAINPSVKFVFTSGYVSPDIRSELVSGGADGFVEKPYIPRVVLQTLRDVLDGVNIPGRAVGDVCK